MKRTPLYAAHQKLGGKLIEFGGWEMPVQYTTITDEHLAVRKAAGLFDISHMGEVFISGPGAEAFLNFTLTNDLSKLAIGQGQYTLMCNEGGGVIDDLYAYRLAAQEYLLIINASRIEADASWLTGQLAGFNRRNEVKLENASDVTGAIAVQGPRVVEFINSCFPGPSAGGTAVAQASDLKKNQVARFHWGNGTLWVSRTGYTGEDGFEVVAPGPMIEAIWDRVMAAGKPCGLKPAGLGARDTLRTEVCYPLYGHELDEEHHADRGRAGLLRGAGQEQFRRPFRAGQAKGERHEQEAGGVQDDGKIRPAAPALPDLEHGTGAAKIGEVVSGTQSPSLGIGIGLGYVPPEFAKPGTALGIEIRGKRAPAVVVPKPIYRKPD